MGTVVAIFVLAALIFHLILNIIFGVKDLISLETLQEIVNHISCAIALVIVTVPEGLPLAITLGLAF